MENIDKSKTSCTYPIVGAVHNAKEFLGESQPWSTINDEQKNFLSKIYNVSSTEVNSIKEIESRVSDKADELNKWMKERGFSIELNKFDPARKEFGCVSIMDVLVEWIEKGTKSKVYFNGDKNQEYPGVCVKEGNTSIFTSKNHPHPIARLQTKSSDYVYMTIAETELDGLKLTTKVRDIEGNMSQNYAHAGVVFPMVELNQEVDITWLKGMKTLVTGGAKKDEWWEISQALQQTKFKMNEVGARAESAAAIGMTRAASVPKPMLRIEKPFLCWISRPGLSAPFFAGFINKQDWKEPAALTK